MQNKPLNVTMRELLAKLDEKSSVEEGKAGELAGKAVGSAYDFLKSLGKGGAKYGEKTGFDAFTEAVKAAQKEADDELVKAVKRLPRITPAEIAAARAEGITTQEWLLKNKPEFYATLENATPEAQAGFFNIVNTTAKDWNPDKDTKKAMAASIIGHIIVLAILSWKSKYLPSSSSNSGSSSSSSSSDSGAKSSLSFAKGATYAVRPDSVDWESMGAPGFKGQGATLNKDGKWTANNGTVITDPKLVAGLDAALKHQLSIPMQVRLIPQAELDASAAQQAQAKLDKEVPVLSTNKDSPVKVKVDPKRRPDLKID